MRPALPSSTYRHRLVRSRLDRLRLVWPALVRLPVVRLPVVLACLWAGTCTTAASAAAATATGAAATAVLASLVRLRGGGGVATRLLGGGFWAGFAGGLRMPRRSCGDVGASTSLSGARHAAFACMGQGT